MSDTININFIKESDLANINYKAESVTLDPTAIIYRGYDDKYSDVDTLKWYYPFTNRESEYNRKIKARPLFYGSYDHTLLYSGRTDTAIPGDGPIYRFWSRRPLRLWSLNYDNVQKAVQFLIKRHAIITALRLIYAFGYLYNNIDHSLQLTKHIMDLHPEYLNEHEMSFLQYLQGSLLDVANKCQNACIQEIDETNEGDNNPQIHHIKDFCYNQCWYEPSTLNSLGRQSIYEVDKPLADCLYDYLSKLGYDGIFSWNESNKPYIQWKHHDIIIFDSPNTLISDNVDVNNNCLSPQLDVCPKKTIQEIPIKRLKNGKYFGRNRQIENFKRDNESPHKCTDKILKPFVYSPRK